MRDTNFFKLCLVSGNKVSSKIQKAVEDLWALVFIQGMFIFFTRGAFEVKIFVGKLFLGNLHVLNHVDSSIRGVHCSSVTIALALTNWSRHLLLIWSTRARWTTFAAVCSSSRTLFSLILFHHVDSGQIFLLNCFGLSQIQAETNFRFHRLVLDRLLVSSCFT